MRTCDHCGEPIDPDRPGQSTAEAVLCGDCVLPHVVNAHPVNEDDVDPDEPTPLEEDGDDPDNTSRDHGDPVGGYDDARNLNAADLMAEIRRMS